MPLILSGGCRLLEAKPEEAAVLEGTLSQFIRVDSEHGSFNGVFSEEIIYDAYLRMPNLKYDEFVLWMTRDTEVYKQPDNFKRVPFNELKGGERVQAHVSEIDKRGYRPAAYAIKITILK